MASLPASLARVSFPALPVSLVLLAFRERPELQVRALLLPQVPALARRPVPELSQSLSAWCQPYPGSPSSMG